MNSTAKSIMIFPSESFSRTEDRTQDRPNPKNAHGDGVYNFGNENGNFYKCKIPLWTGQSQLGSSP